MQLIYLSKANLTDRMFVRDFVHNFKFQRSITIHEPMEDILKTKMMTKRISSLLSDAMTYNRAFTGDQRGMVTQTDQGIAIRKEQLEPLLDHVQTLIIGPLMKQDKEVAMADSMQLIQVLRELYQVKEIVCFSDNPLSPLVTKKPVITSQEQVDQYLIAYEEERAALGRALALRPARLCSPVNFAM